MNVYVKVAGARRVAFVTAACYNYEVVFESVTRNVGTDPWASKAQGFCVSRRLTLKTHLYEFVSKSKKLKCLCGWERTLKTSDAEVIYKKFKEHCAEASRLHLL